MKISGSFASGLLLTALAASTSVHAENDKAPMGKFKDHVSRPIRRHHQLAARAAPSNAADMAKVMDPNQACKPYGVAASQTLANTYPKSDQIASIQENDQDAQAIWSEIQKSGIIPQNVQVKKGVQNHMGISQQQSNSYDVSNDPDCWWSASQCTKPKAKNIPADIYNCEEPNTWGLTFDDGPNCSHNAFYDFLKKQNLKATLFYIGANVINLPLHAQRGLADGHHICGHSWSHHYMTTLSNEQVFAELYYTMRIIKDVMGVTTTCWRPPFGDVDDRVRAIAAGLGLRTILWSEDTDDWDVQPGGSSPRSKIVGNYQKIFDKGKNHESEIVLTHEIRSDTMQLFQDMFPQLKNSFNNIIPLTACLNVTQPYIEDNISYAIFSDFIKGNIVPKGLPDMDNMPINPDSKINVQSLDKQKQGGFSPAAISNANRSPNTSTSSSGGGQSQSSSNSGSGAQPSSSSSNSKQGSSKDTPGNSSMSNHIINIYALVAVVALSIAILV